VPENRYSQCFARDFMTNLHQGDPDTQEFLKRIYDGSAIESRYSVVSDYGKAPEDYTFYPPNESLEPEPTTEKRNAVFTQEANRLSLQASRQLLADLGTVGPEDITHLITVTCTGFSAPGFDFHLTKQLPLRPNVDRFQLGFMGCYAAFSALKLANSICAADPTAKVLVVNVELCTVHFQKKKDHDTLVANAIFADGVSAALVSADSEDSTPPRFRFNNFLSQYLEESEDDMAWKIGQTGFDMKLSVYVPRLIKRNISSIVDDLLAKGGTQRDAIDLWAFHPGGRSILDKVAVELDLPDDALRYSYEILKEYGNMSSVTIMFVLKRFLEHSDPGRLFAAAFGPGLTVESAYMQLER
jgi:predicted naringenin-chalcone synthase